jgi:ParB family chromosome partitioning protein
MYRYFSFDALPEFIRNDLNNNPRLLSRSAASDIRRIGQNNQTPLYINFLTEAWGLFLSGDLEQTKIAGYIIRKLKAAEDGNKDCHIQSTHNLIKDGKKVGYISWAGKHMTIKLIATAFDEKKEKKLQVFLENLMDAEVSEV